MYPLIRLLKENLRFRNAPPLGLYDAHVTTLICWPWDIDPWWELNNGRTLTLYDLGRLPLGKRTGLEDVLRAKRWGLAVAGSTIRYRRRVTAFQRFEMRSRFLGWDERFLYVEQSMWRGDTCTSAALIRSAVLENRRMIPASRLLEAMGHGDLSPSLPDWAKAWAEADALRPWPPEG